MWLAVTGIHPRLPAPDARTKQGSFPPTALSCTAISGTTTPSDSLRAEDRLRLAAYTASSSGGGSSTTGPGRVSPVPRSTLSTFRALYAGRFLGAALPSSSTPSLAFAQSDGARLLAPVARVTVTTRQTSLDAADCGLARLLSRLHRGASPVGFPLAAAASYRGGLAPPRAGHSPAG